jgi:3-hydroxymyristoyl/3-hydroxydecanoyl-(acyl carrier protein) dehydratase
MTDSSTLTQLRKHFSSAHWPRMNAISSSEHRCVIDLFIAADMHWLEGHFPQQPVVAGVVQTHWAGELAKYVFATGDECIRIDNLKFQQVMLPGQSLQLTLDYSGGATTAVKFRYSHEEALFSEGKLVFNTPAASSDL